MTVLPEIQWVWLLLAIAAGLGIVVLYARNVRFFLVFIICIIFGFLWMFWSALDILAQQLPKEIEGQQVTIQGRIINVPIQNKFNIQFDLYATSLVYQQKNYPFQSKVRLKWYFKADKEPKIIKPDQLWQFTVKLKRPHFPLNFGVFDYSKYLFIKRINAIGNISNAQKNQAKLLNAPRPYQLQSIRYQLIQNIHNSIGELPYAGVILAMGLGERSLITQNQWTLFRQTGTSHLVAISGLHISSIAFVIFFISKFFWHHLGRVALRFPAIYFATIISLLAISFYVFLAGFSISAQRSFIMVLGFLLPNLLSRNLSHSHRISLSLLFVLIHDPMSTLSAGFWLSFTIVSIIIYFSQFIYQHGIKQDHLKSIRYFLLNLFIFQLIISIVNYPLSQYFFQESVLFAGLFSNFIMIPLTTFIILPFVLIGILVFLISPPISIWIFTAISSILSYSFGIAESIVEFEKIASIYLNLFDLSSNNISLISIFITITSVLILFAPKGFSIRWLGLIGLLSLFFNFFPEDSIKQGEFELTVLDVGQNLAVVIKTQEHQLIYDTANGWMSYSVIIPYLKAHKLSQLDLLIASHADNDHSGGVNNIAQKIHIHQILTGAVEIKRIQRFFKKPLQQNIDITQCKTGQKWQWDGVQFEILHPAKNPQYLKRNNRSCILKINGIKSSVLLTGDISSRVEAILLQQQKSKLKADILIVPHHGSKTSSSASFLQAVNPKIAVFSTAYLNHYHHPHPDIVKRYQHYKIKTLNTADTGAIYFSPRNESFLQPILARETMRRIWH
ncbi:MAG: DNA internalization-related competence protein ComEC/Rec2 [Thiotrichaceae bacterium]|nr:DNA internalization-related competence protein ComEC/Rec2 [Thiotrichaceae bacterium]